MRAGVRDELGVPLGIVLEGGYDLDALAASMAALVPVLGAADGSPRRRSSPCTRSPPTRGSG